MPIITFPTGKDIFIEIDGKRLAVAQSYKSKTVRESRYVEAFGSAEPVGTIGGKCKHLLELSRVYMTKQGISDGIDFHNLSGFNVIIIKPDRKIIYSGCECSGIDEVAAVGEVLIETVTIVATKRLEITA